jgi:Flp pilus assembly pilin Flp
VEKRWRLTDFFKEIRGGSAAEYSILLACIAMVILGAVTLFGNTVSSALFNLAASTFP